MQDKVAVDGGASTKDKRSADIHKPSDDGDVNSGENGSGVDYNRRDERSFLMGMLQHFLRPIGPAIVKPKKAFPAGSPQVHAPHSVKVNCEIHQRCVENIYLYDIIPKINVNGSEPVKLRGNIYYFAGGAFQSPPTSDHWKFGNELGVRLRKAGCDVVITFVSYPLAPNSPAPVALPHLQHLYRKLLVETQEQGRQLLLMGDSAGANIALSIAIQGVNEDPSGPHASAVFAVCPAVDLSHENPESLAIDSKDPVLRIKHVSQFANVWRGEWDAKDPRVSPLFADLTKLAGVIAVHGITAGLDVLGPDGRKFREKCERSGVKGEWMDWEKQMHCFTMTWQYGFSESKQALNWIVDVLVRQMQSENIRFESVAGTAHLSNST